MNMRVRVDMSIMRVEVSVQGSLLMSMLMDVEVKVRMWTVQESTKNGMDLWKLNSLRTSEFCLALPVTVIVVEEEVRDN